MLELYHREKAFSDLLDNQPNLLDAINSEARGDIKPSDVIHFRKVEDVFRQGVKPCDDTWPEVSESPPTVLSDNEPMDVSEDVSDNASGITQHDASNGLPDTLSGSGVSSGLSNLLSDIPEEGMLDTWKKECVDFNNHIWGFIRQFFRPEASDDQH